MGKTPSPPDPVATANAQAAANDKSASKNLVLGNVNERGPLGQVDYSFAPVQMSDGSYVDQATKTTTLSPEQQALMDLSNQTQTNLGQIGVERSGNIGDMLSGNIDYSQFQDFGQAPDVTQQKGSEGISRYGAQDLGANNVDAVQQALFDQSMEQLEPAWRDEKSQLAAMGGYATPQAGERYFQQGRRENNASQNAILAAGAEQRARDNALQQRGMYDLGLNQADNTAATMMFDQGMSRYGADNALRSQQIQEAYARRAQPINEVTALQSGSQVSLPTFKSAQGSQTAAGDVQGNIWRAYDAEKANSQQMMQDIGMLGGTAASFMRPKIPEIR